jgi:hypothetical protein
MKISTGFLSRILAAVLIAWSTAEGLVLETLPSDRVDVLWVSTGFFVRVIDMAVAL